MLLKKLHQNISYSHVRQCRACHHLEGRKLLKRIFARYKKKNVLSSRCYGGEGACLEFTSPGGRGCLAPLKDVSRPCVARYFST